MTFNDLLASYGWQLAIVGLIGTFVVGFLKKPFNSLIRKGKEGETKAEQTFDVVAFVLGFVVAVILSCTYTALAHHFGWLKTNDEQLQYNVFIYLSNSVGGWLYQLLYYQLWKKVGLKRLWDIIKRKVKGLFDRNKDGNIDGDELSAVILGMLKNGKLNLDEIISTVTTVAPEVAQEVIDQVTEEAGEAGKVDTDDAIAKLNEITKTLLAGIPESKLSSVANAVVDKASEKIKEAADNPVEVADSAKVHATDPKRPSIKF